MLFTFHDMLLLRLCRIFSNYIGVSARITTTVHGESFALFTDVPTPNYVIIPTQFSPSPHLSCENSFCVNQNMQ